MLQTQSTPTLYPHSHLHRHTEWTLWGWRQHFLCQCQSKLPVETQARQTGSGHTNRRVKIVYPCCVKKTRYFNPEMRRRAAAEPKHLCVYFIICIIICSRLNWGGAWLLRAGALWNTKYCMEDPVKTLPQQLEVRDRSGREERRAASQRTVCARRHAVFRQHWNEPHTATAARAGESSEEEHGRSVRNQSAFQESFSLDDTVRLNTSSF